MSSFQLPRLCFPDGRPSTQCMRPIETRTSSLSLPPLPLTNPMQRSATHLLQSPGSNAQLPSASLPPITQSHARLLGSCQNNGISPMVSLGSGLGLGTCAVQVNSLPSPALLPISPSEAHHLTSGGRQKKEVKRRAKTGCLTCRKRRIKVSHHFTKVSKW